MRPASLHQTGWRLSDTGGQFRDMGRNQRAEMTAIQQNKQTPRKIVPSPVASYMMQQKSKTKNMTTEAGYSLPFDPKHARGPSKAQPPMPTCRVRSQERSVWTLQRVNQ